MIFFEPDSKRHRGFTLIELSLVLVVLGLVIGGVLVGRDLIRTTGLQKDIARIQELDTAIGTFKMQFNCLPGDCNNVSSYFPGLENGNGDGLIACAELADTTVIQVNYVKSESSSAAAALTRAGLIALSSAFDGQLPVNGASLQPGIDLVSVPSHPAYGIVIGIGRASALDTAPRGNRYLVGVKDSMTNENAVQTLNPPYTTADAYFIDTKMDDGQGLKGRVLSAMVTVWDDTNFIPSVPAASATCLSDGNNNYNLNETAPRCALLMKPGF